MAEKAVLFLVPCLNEVAVIAETLEYLMREARSVNGGILVIDGGSTDGTVEKVQVMAEADDIVELTSNPARLQAAAINLGVERFVTQEYFIRVDAHGRFPDGFAQTLLNEAKEHEADSVVVAMTAVGSTPFQQAAAIAQNSIFGNGGSAHRRLPPGGAWVDHGHHALMSVASFAAVGGYDETFSHNEDAELDLRLTAAGAKIWLTSAITLDYFPRDSAGALARQYFSFGRGRCRTLFKHHTRPRLRQAVLVGVAPSLALALATPFVPFAWVPAAIWATAGIAFGSAAVSRSGDVADGLAGPAALIMHAAWSAGFWREAATQLAHRRSEARDTAHLSADANKCVLRYPLTVGGDTDRE